MKGRPAASNLELAGSQINPRKEASYSRARWLPAELDAIRGLRKQARHALISAGRQHPDYQRLLSIPAFGPVRVAQLLAV